jgi:hypothetical protein
MVLKYAKIFHCKTLQNLPKLGFLFWKKPSGNPGTVATYVGSFDCLMRYMFSVSFGKVGTKFFAKKRDQLFCQKNFMSSCSQ